jgi:hypothetical protein
VTGVVAQVVWDLEAADHGWPQARHIGMLRWGYLQRRLHNGVASAEVVNQQEGCEEEENQ